MAFVKGWVPLRGSGQTLPLIQYEHGDFSGSLSEQNAKWAADMASFDLNNFPKVFPYTVKAIDAPLSGQSVKDSYKYTINNKDGTTIAGISDVYIYTTASAKNLFIYGTNITTHSTIANLSTSLDSDYSVLYERIKNRVYVITYDPYGSLSRKVKLKVTAIDSLPASNMGGDIAINLDSLEWYPTREEALHHAFPENPYNPGGNSGPAGGGGGFGNDRENDDITQLIPTGSAANSLTDAGIFSHYLVNSAQLKDFSRWLFSDNFLEVLGKELIELWWGDTFGAIISLMSYPFAVGKLPMITSEPSNIYLGHFDTHAVSSGLLTSESSQLDWGNIDITEYWGNFLDYAPHTKIQLYLPWGTGFVDIDPNECMNGSLNVKTNIELSKGNCVHIVSNSSGAVIGTYNGFCGAQYPITSKDTSGKAIGTVISAVSAAVAIGSAAVTGGASIAGNVAATAANAAAELGLSGTVGKEFKAEAEAAFAKADKFRKVTSTAAKTAAVSSIAAARTPVNYVRSGSFSPNAGHLAVQVPYIIMTWPDQSVPEQYGNFVGYPSNIFARLGSLNGYTEVGAIHLDYINCTEHEREELLRILQGGVIL